MSGMINQVAEALCYAKPVTFEEMASVAIAAMRVPSEALSEAMNVHARNGMVNWRDLHEEMINEALK